jgi:hypothetical protein
MLIRFTPFGLILLLGVSPVVGQTIFSDGFECGDVVAWSAPNPEASEVSGMTCEHNAARASVNAGAVPGQPAANPPIPMMAWSSELTSVAQAWAENCQWMHNPNRSTQAGLGVYVGENIFASTWSGHAIPATVVDAWFSEYPEYDYDSNSCTGVCGHYTQIVWRNSTLVGCGSSACTSNSPFSSGGTWYFVVCNYAPGGNYSGQRPY